MAICSGAFAQENIIEENGTFYLIEQKIRETAQRTIGIERRNSAFEKLVFWFGCFFRN